MKLRPLPPSLMAQRVVARREFHRALMDGVIKRRNSCQRCRRRRKPGAHRNSVDGVSAHHADYLKPLDVEWLCHWCHLDADQEVNRHLRSLPEPEAVTR